MFSTEKTTNRHTFNRFGQALHLQISSAQELKQVVDMDEALWVATGAPIKALKCDPDVLRYMDSDNNSRIMCYELKTAINWLLNTVTDTSGIDTKSTILKLDSINTNTEDGNKILRSCKRMLAKEGLSDSNEITKQLIQKTRKAVEDDPENDAGVILPNSTDNDDIKNYIKDVVDTIKGVAHPSGAIGIKKTQHEEFQQKAQDFIKWHNSGNLAKNGLKSEIMPLGTKTHASFKIFSSLKEKIDQYFAQCHLVALNKNFSDYISPNTATMQSCNTEDITEIEKLLTKSPIAPPSSTAVLNMDAVNPYYANAINQLNSSVISVVLTQNTRSLTENDWIKIKDFFAIHEQWVMKKTGSEVEKLETEKLQKYISSDFTSLVDNLIDECNKSSVLIDNIKLAEQLILYQSTLIDFANNFVSFPHLYNPSSRAMFEMGTLIIDGRHLTFSIQVNDRAQHMAVAKMSNIFTLYVEIETNNKEQNYEVVLPVTSGGKGNLCIGKRGVFHDINGNEYDAKVVNIIENPISLTETLVAPFQRIGRMLTGKIEAMTSEAEKKLDTTTSSVITAHQPVAEQAPNSKGLLAGGMLMGGGVALAALGSALAYITNTLAHVEVYKIILVVLGAFIAVIAPASIIAVIKLRKRDLSSILEGAGWAINSRMRLTFNQGRMFTRSAKLPKGSKINLT